MSTIAEKLSHPEFALPVSKAMIVGSAFSGLARGNFFDPRSFDSASRFLKGVLERIFVGSLIPEGFLSADSAFAEPPFTPYPTVTLRAVALDEDAPSRSISPILLRAAALALAGVGIAMNGWFARSLGSSDAAGWLFFATGVAADLVALVAPSCAARLWQARHRATSLAGWAVWGMTFVFAVTAGVGFASTNITDVTVARSSRVTPAVAAAQAALSDAMSARDHECKGGVGKFCRERELAVNERRQALDTAMQAVGQTADPQTDAAIRIVAWATHGALQPAGNDFAMLRLVLLALLPQIGGILLMVGRSAGAAADQVRAGDQSQNPKSPPETGGWRRGADDLPFRSDLIENPRMNRMRRVSTRGTVEEARGTVGQ